MSIFNWTRFLTRWSQELLASLGDEIKTLPSDVLRSGWLGYAGATEAQIAEAEAQLRLVLPPSYRAFLKITNGWRYTTPFIYHLWPVERIALFPERRQEWLDAFLTQQDSDPLNYLGGRSRYPHVSDTEYLIYGVEQDCSKLRLEYLFTALEISDRGDGSIYLLNPKIVAANGEWEAWFFGDWLPGADRYPSFQELMEAEYEIFLELREVPATMIAMEMADGRSPYTSLETEPVDQPVDQPIQDVVQESVADIAIELEPDHPLQPTLDQEIVQLSDSGMFNPSRVSNAVPLHEPFAYTNDWQMLGQFAVEIQSQSAPLGDRPHRLSVEHVSTSASLTLPEGEFHRLAPWMLQHVHQPLRAYSAPPQVPPHQTPISEDLASGAIALSSSTATIKRIKANHVQPEPVPVERQISSLQTAGLRVYVQQKDPTSPLLITPEQSHLDLELVLVIPDHLDCWHHSHSLTVDIQTVAHNLTTGQVTPWDTHVILKMVQEQSVWAIALPVRGLPPGLYRLQILVIIPLWRVAPAYTEMPLLRVI